MVKIENVVKTISGSTISSRRGHDNKSHNLEPHAFPWVRDRFLMKKLQGSSPSGGAGSGAQQ